MPPSGVHANDLSSVIHEIKEILSVRTHTPTNASLAEEILSRMDKAEADHQRDIEQLRFEIQNISRFDWKWFFGIVIPIIFVITIASVTFHGRLTAQQRDITHIQSDLSETNTRIGDLETRGRALEIGQATIIGELKLINEKLDVLKKP